MTVTAVSGVVPSWARVVTNCLWWELPPRLIGV